MGGMSATQGSPSKPARVEDKQNCIPVSVRCVLDAAAELGSDAKGDLRIHGSEVAVVVLVGMVEGLVKQTSSLEFTMNDATGRIKVKYYMAESAGVEKLENGAYVSIVGNVRTSPAVHVSVLSLRAVQSANEVSYHMIEAAYANVKLSQKPAEPAPTSTAMDFPTPSKEFSSPAAQQSPAQPPAQQVKPVGDVNSQILEVLRRDGEGLEEGVEKSVLLKKLDTLTADSITAALDKLVDAGEVFRTIDDDHFACV